VSGLKGDIQRLFSAQGTHGGRPSLWAALERVVTRPGPLAIVLYRFSHALWARGLHTLAELVWRFNLLVSGADIHPGAAIGGGLRIVHTSGIVVGKGVVVGSNVTLLHGVTLGGSGRGFFGDTSPDGFPTIEDDCKISAGAKVLGPVTIGQGAFIGANAVVAKDVPAGAVFNPGKDSADLRRRVEQLEARIQELESELDSRASSHGD
jgi:serine O-acetyltransferase